MYMTGFADEAAITLDGQIKATQELGWQYIESRSIDKINIHNLDNKAFDEVEAKLKDANIKINCFGSTIANWQKEINQPIDSSIEEAKRAIERMHRLDTKLIRIMSFALLKDNEPDNQMKEERFKRLRLIVDMFLTEGLTPVHENCMNYGGLSYKHTLELIDNVPGLKLVFDTGNPVFTDDRSQPKPYPKQNSWEFYSAVREHISYIHIKDGVWNNAKEDCDYTYPGQGQGCVKEIMADLIKNNYDGGISIEPHMAAVFHDNNQDVDENEMYNIYVEYGKQMQKMILDLGGIL